MQEVGEPHPGQRAFLARRIPAIATERHLVDLFLLRGFGQRQDRIVVDPVDTELGFEAVEQDDVRVPFGDLLGADRRAVALDRVRGVHPADQLNLPGAVIALVAGGGQVLERAAEIEHLWALVGRDGLGLLRHLLGDRVAPAVDRGRSLGLAHRGCDHFLVVAGLLFGAVGNKRDVQPRIADRVDEVGAVVGPLDDQFRIGRRQFLDIRDEVRRGDVGGNVLGFREDPAQHALDDRALGGRVHADQPRGAAVHGDDGRGHRDRDRGDALGRLRQRDGAPRLVRQRNRIGERCTGKADDGCQAEGKTMRGHRKPFAKVDCISHNLCAQIANMNILVKI